MQFSYLDYGVFAAYVLIIIGAGLLVSRGKKGEEKTSEDYFLASKSLPWWAIGASLIASNISAEQFIGMSGSGFALGLGISTYEWMAAATLIIVGKFFLPIFLEKKIYTMPQYLESRYDARVRTILAVFWILVYVFVNLTSVLYLGALAIKTIMGVDITYAIVGLALFALIYSIYGGLTAVAWTDVIQVIFLVAGGLVTTVLALKAVGGGEILAGLNLLRQQAPDKFHMILQPTNSEYMNLPGITILIGGMWITNLNYWGCNQYITQRALAAKSLGEAQRGVVFAGFLKLLIPLLVVIPGIAAFVLQQNGTNLGIVKPDEAYPALLHTFVPSGWKGMAFAALVAAIVSSLASMMNSTATIFTMDLYKNYFNKTASEKTLVNTGRIVSVIALAIAVIVAPAIGNIEQAFQYIQEFTGLVSPGIFVIFIFGFFWKKANANGAFWVALLTLPLSLGLKYMLPTLPFLDRMSVVFVALSLVMMVSSLMDKQNIGLVSQAERLKFILGLALLALIPFLSNLLALVGLTLSDTPFKIIIHTLVAVVGLWMIGRLKGLNDNKKAIHADSKLFATDAVFNFGSLAIVILLVILYAIYW